MRKSMIVTVILSVITLVVISLSVTFAWFLNVNKTDAIDTTTKGIVFSYTITDGKTSKKDVAVYDVKNVAFFDIDSEYEGKYFENMACLITLEYENICDDNISLNLNFESINPNVENSPYLDVVFTTNKIESTAEYSTVQDIIDDYKDGDSNKNFVVDNLISKKKINVYMYIFGVQPNDGANNDFLTSDRYGFKLTTKAVKKNAEAGE